MPLPVDYIPAVWRGVPNGTGVGIIALDPREAAWVLEHGCTIDGERWSATAAGWSPLAQSDGRVVVRLFKVDRELK